MNRWAAAPLFLLGVVVLSEAFPCNVNVKFRSLTDKKFKVVMAVPSLEIKTEQIIFDGKDQNKKVQVKGEDCEKKKWIIRTFKENGKGDWELAKKMEAKLWGNGWFRVMINDDYMPYIMDRMGVACSEGGCGR